MKNTVKFEFLSLSENEALARSVAAAFIMQVRLITTIQNKSARQLMPNSKEADINC